MSPRDKDFLPREEIETVQLKRLKETVERVYHLVPFYRRKFDEVGIKPSDVKSLEDLKRLPFTTSKRGGSSSPTGMSPITQSLCLSN